MENAPDETARLLERWHRGDERALSVILERNLPFVRAYVHRRLGAKLRGRAETVDYVQDALVEFLRYGPRFLLANGAHLRALLAKIVENVLRDKNDWYAARRREMNRERPLPEDSALLVGAADSLPTTPSEAAERSENEMRLRLALELLAPADRKVILLREYDRMTFVEVGRRVGLGENAARMRYQRALARLAKQMDGLGTGRLADLLEDETPHTR